MRRVVLWSTDPVGEVMAGPGIRYHRLAVELARHCDVTLVAPGGGVADAPYGFRRAEDVTRPSEVAADVVVAQSLPLRLMRGLTRTGARLVFDLYAPALVEAAAYIAHAGGTEESSAVRYDEVVATTRIALQLGNGFVCASERQRDHWLGALAALGRVSPEAYAADPSFRSLVAVVPFGLDAEVSPLAPRVKGVFPGIATSDRLLLWGGGIWNWFDPLTVIRAVGRLSASRRDVRLLFLGLTHPSSAVGTMSMADAAVSLAHELGLAGRSVFFNHAWVPYSERIGWFADADIGVSAHRDTLEARLAFRTRLLDHIAVGTPLVVTEGDVLAELVRSRRMGRVAAAEDVDGWASALAELLDDAGAYSEARSAVIAAQEELSWARSGEALAGLIEDVASSSPSDPVARWPYVRAATTLARCSLERRGLRATLAAAAQTASGRRNRGAVDA